jgi:hypothetical protein
MLQGALMMAAILVPIAYGAFMIGKMNAMMEVRRDARGCVGADDELDQRAR